MQFQISFLSISLDRNLSFHLPNTFFSLKTSNPSYFRPILVSNQLVWSFYPSFFMHFTHLDLGFGFSWNFWGFWKLMSILWNFWVGCYVFLCNMTMHCIPLAFSQCFMHLDVCLYVEILCAVRIGLGWTHDVNFFFHITCSCTFLHTYHFNSFFWYLLWWCFSVSLPLSLSFSFSLSLSLSLS